MTGRNLLAPETLRVKGRAISPSPTTPNNNNNYTDLDVSMHSSSRTSMSEPEEDAASEEYTVLDGVREMNHILVRQIETLRLKIKVDEKNYDNDKAKILEEKDYEIKEKEDEIEDLKESLTNRDERIHDLSKASEEKDRTIRSKSAEIESLRQIVQQTEEYASKLQKQMGKVQSDRDRLEGDSLYKEQNEEIKRLTEELELLRERLGTMEGELQRAMTVIEQQSEKMKSMDAERVELQQKFREDLDRASKAMRQEVERMREVMRQNYEEMRNLREQNKEMASDVRAIKDMLRKARTNGHVTSSTTTDLHHNDIVTGMPRPLTNTPNPKPTNSRQTNGHTSNLSPIGPGKMVGGNIAHKTPTGRQPSSLSPHTPLVSNARESSASRDNKNGGLRISGNNNRRGEDASPSRLSPDNTARTLPKGQTPRISSFPQPGQINLNIPIQNGKTANITAAQKNLPPICSIREVTTPLARQPSGRAGKGVVRKGSAVVKKQ